MARTDSWRRPAKDVLVRDSTRVKVLATMSLVAGVICGI